MFCGNIEIVVAKAAGAGTIERMPSFACISEFNAEIPIKLVSSVLVLAALCSCASSTPDNSRVRSKPPQGFFERVADQFTERECNVFRFTCPYGLGPAGELCTCTDPGGLVITGRTIK
jgi:hypothetical protein